MKTNQHLDALAAAIAESRATLRDLHEADGAVDELIRESLPWTYTTTSKAHVREQQLAGRVMAMRKRWSWLWMCMEYELTIRV